MKMTLKKLKSFLGRLLIIFHIFLFLLTCFYFFITGFTQEEFFTVIGLIFPLFGYYVGIVIDDLTKNVFDNLQTRHSSVKNARHYINPDLVFSIFLIIGIFYLWMIVIISLKAFNVGNVTFSVLKGLIALSETVFLGYFGRLFSTLYSISNNSIQD